ncbi:hypothetical protein [Psychrobacillus sp. NPDC093180]
MFSSPEQVMVAVVTLAMAIYIGILWREFTGETKKTDQLGKADQQVTKYY